MSNTGFVGQVNQLMNMLSLHYKLWREFYYERTRELVKAGMVFQTTLTKVDSHVKVATDIVADATDIFSFATQNVCHKLIASYR